MLNKILIIAPLNNNYPLDIKHELEKRGCEVHIYDERNNPSFIDKIIYRKKPELNNKKIAKYFSFIESTEKLFNPDYILFISPETINEKCLLSFRETFKTSFFVLYMWDALKNKNKNVKNIFKHFDKVLSFDKKDCEKYGFVFRPLFFPSFCLDICGEEKHIYDVSFIGTAHSDRAKITYQMAQICKNNNWNYYFYLFAQGRFMFFKNYLFDKYFRKLSKMKITHSSTLRKDLVYNIMSSSNCILDINHPQQTGLTMRTIETLGFNKKLLTTNETIKEYDFYNANNIMVFDRLSPQIDLNFVKEEYIKPNRVVYENYSLKKWIDVVFGE